MSRDERPASRSATAPAPTTSSGGASGSDWLNERAIRERAASSPRAKLGGLLMRPALRAFRDEIDPEGPGGAYLLGLRRLGVVPHGRFTRYGISQAILLAARGTTGDVVGRTHAALGAAGALRSAPVASVPGE